MANLGVKPEKTDKRSSTSENFVDIHTEEAAEPVILESEAEQKEERQEQAENITRTEQAEGDTTSSEVAVQTAVEKSDKLRESSTKIKDQTVIEEAISSLKNRIRKPKKHKLTDIPIVRDALTINVETIMEEDLKDAFKQLTPIQKQEFKIKGEETARQIRDLLRATHVKVKQIFKLLMNWLKMLPGINRFFLEQEAKIKADKIMALKLRQRTKE